jgi:hypothetical protein
VQVKIALALSMFLLSCGNEAQPTNVTPTIDPNLPREDPASYPEAPIVGVPPAEDSAGDAGTDGGTARP